MMERHLTCGAIVPQRTMDTMPIGGQPLAVSVQSRSSAVSESNNDGRYDGTRERIGDRDRLRW